MSDGTGRHSEDGLARRSEDGLARAGPAHRDDPRLVEEAWTRVAERYAAYWSPRFRPYLLDAVGALRPPPEGPLAVPGCGPGEEVLLLAEQFPERPIIATDPSTGMLRILWSALRDRGIGQVVASSGGAESLSAFVRQAAGVLSSFSLQLLPNPLAALADWSRALRPGGRIAALFWPRKPEDSAVGRLHEAIEKGTGERRPSWEDTALEALPRIGLRLVSDTTVAHEMVHASPEEYFDEIVRSGPLQALEMRAGRDTVERCRAAWLAAETSSARPWKHAPPARLWELERLEGFEPDHH